MTTQNKHTPLPYKVVKIERRYPEGIKTVATIYNGDVAVARCGSVEDANFITLACNSHYELVENLVEMMPFIPPKDAQCHRGIVTQDKCANCTRIINAHRAVARATGKGGA